MTHPRSSSARNASKSSSDGPSQPSNAANAKLRFPAMRASCIAPNGQLSGQPATVVGRAPSLKRGGPWRPASEKECMVSPLNQAKVVERLPPPQSRSQSPPRPPLQPPILEDTTTSQPKFSVQSRTLNTSSMSRRNWTPFSRTKLTSQKLVETER